MILAQHGTTKGINGQEGLVDLRVLKVDLPEIQGLFVCFSGCSFKT
jgi:hypothetical protein